MKKFVSLFLALMLVIGLCSFATADDVVTLRVYPQQNICPDDARVSAALSEITMELYGFKVELVVSDDFKTKIPLLIASDEPMDLVFDASYIDLYGRARSGAYLDITDLLPEYPALVEAVNPALWEGSKIDGRNYCVPTNKEVPAATAFYVAKSVLDNACIDPATIKTHADLEVILAALKNDSSRYDLQIALNDYFPTSYKMVYGDTMSTSKVAWMSYENPGVFQNWYATPEYMEYVKMMNSWYEKGYIPENIATGTFNYAYFNTDGSGNNKIGLAYAGYAPFQENNYEPVDESGAYLMLVGPAVNTTSNCTGSTWCVLKKSEHPTEAMQFLELMNTNTAVKNLMAYGLEGSSYTLVDGKIQMVTDSHKLYNGQNWKTGNIFVATLLTNEPDNKVEVYEAYNASAINSPMLGFNPDASEIQDKITAINGVIAEYCPLLEVGVLDAEEYIPVLLSELESVGVNDVIAWYQAQYDAWKN